MSRRRVGGGSGIIVDSPMSRLSKRMTRKPLATSRSTNSIGQPTSCPPNPITNRRGSPSSSPWRSYSIMMPLTLAAVMAGHAIAWRDEEHRVAPIGLLTGATPSLKIAWGSDTVPTMGLFRRAPNNDAEIEQLRTEMASLREALEQHGSSTFKLEGQLRALGSPPPEPEVPPAVPAEPDPRLDELAAQLAALDDRVTAVATEL